MYKGMKKANAILEYGVILFVAVSAIIAMQPFLKRTIQARVKDLTDDYIASGEKGTMIEPAPPGALVNVSVSGGANGEGSSSLTSSHTLSEWHGGEMNVDSSRDREWNSKTDQGVADIIDYAKKPPEMKHPDIEYIEWDQRWNLVQ